LRSSVLSPVTGSAGTAGPHLGWLKVQRLRLNCGTNELQSKGGLTTDNPTAQTSQGRSVKRDAFRLIDEGMMLAQTLIDEANDLEHLNAAQRLFASFHHLRWLYKEMGIDPKLKY